MEHNGAYVLVVDDMAINRSILSSMLSSFNVMSDLAGSAAECLECCRKNHYDLILLDHRMPEVDGVDTLVHLKELFRRNGTDIPIVCHTAESAKDNINLYKAAGFADVLLKPVDPEDLARILLTYLPEGSVDGTSLSVQKKNIESELAILPVWLKSVPKLDLRSGLEHCGDAEDFLQSLEVFAKSIHEKSDEIDEYCRAGNWPMYSLRTHSLKSMAGLVGAKELADEAAKLEYLSRQEETGDLPSLTKSLLDHYRAFEPLLDHFKKADKAPDVKEQIPDRPSDFKTILFVEGTHGMVNKGIINKLEEAGFRIICVPDEPSEILEHRHDADFWLYYPAGDSEHIRLISSHLVELCEDDDRTMFLVGDALDIAEARQIHNPECIGAEYARPIDMDAFVDDMLSFSGMQYEAIRTKTIFLIDDDPDFLSVTERWLKDRYRVRTFRSGNEALFYLNSTVPDLILLDYIMPGMDGFEAMQKIRQIPRAHDVPIVFLTGQSDRENVMRILEKKPDGYLLKSMPKDALMDSLDRLFRDIIIKNNTLR